MITYVEIDQLNAAGNVQLGDLFEIQRGSNAFKVTSDEIKSFIGGLTDNIYTADGILANNRIVNCDDYTLQITGGNNNIALASGTGKLLFSAPRIYSSWGPGYLNVMGIDSFDGIYLNDLINMENKLTVVNQDEAHVGGLNVLSYSNAGSNIPAIFIGGRAGGTYSAPTIVPENEQIAIFGGAGYDGTSHSPTGKPNFNSAAYMAIMSASGQSAGNTPGYIEFYTNPSNAFPLFPRVRVSSQGSLISSSTETILETYEGGGGPITSQFLTISTTFDTNTSLLNISNTPRDFLTMGYARGIYTTPQIVQSGDVIGNIDFRGFDGIKYLPCMGIKTVVTGTPALNSIDSQLSFFTHLTGAPLLELNSNVSSTFYQYMETVGTFGGGYTIGSPGGGCRSFFYPRKGAFRAGVIDGAQWDDSNIGNYSIVMGQNGWGTGPNTTVIGGYNCEINGAFNSSFSSQNIIISSLGMGGSVINSSDLTLSGGSGTTIIGSSNALSPLTPGGTNNFILGSQGMTLAGLGSTSGLIATVNSGLDVENGPNILICTSDSSITGSVANGSFVLGGTGNSVMGTESGAIGTNTGTIDANGFQSLILASYTATVSGSNSVGIAGLNISNYGNRCFVGGGQQLHINISAGPTSDRSVLLGGLGNSLNGFCSDTIIIGGSTNSIGNAWSSNSNVAIICANNTTTNPTLPNSNCVVVGGVNNSLGTNHAYFFGSESCGTTNGQNHLFLNSNTCSASNGLYTTFISALNCINSSGFSYNAMIATESSNVVANAQRSAIVGGTNNSIQAASSVILGSNTTIVNTSVIALNASSSGILSQKNNSIILNSDNGVGLNNNNPTSGVSIYPTLETKSVLSATSANTENLNSVIIRMNTDGAPIILTLSDTTKVNGRIYVIINAGTSGNPLGVQPESGLINGASSYNIATDWSSIVVTTDGTNWYIVAKNIN